jgi:hypothetical protein
MPRAESWREREEASRSPRARLASRLGRVRARIHGPDPEARVDATQPAWMIRNCTMQVGNWARDTTNAWHVRERYLPPTNSTIYETPYGPVRVPSGAMARIRWELNDERVIEYSLNALDWHRAYPLDPDDPAVQRERVIAARRADVGDLRRRVADRRAKALLLAHLDDQQREDFERDEAFFVEVGPRRYRIDATGRSGNILLVRDGDQLPREDGWWSGEVTRYLVKYCVHIEDYGVPLYDNLLGQALLIASNEEQFLRMANVMSDRRAAPTPPPDFELGAACDCVQFYQCRFC